MSDDLAPTLRAASESVACKSRWRVRQLAWVPLFIIVLLQGCAATSPARDEPGSAEGDSTVTLIVVRRGWHIDVGFSTAQLHPPLDAIGASFASSQYLLFGFGDKHYLVAKHKSFPQMLGALWPGEAMMLVTSLDISPEEAFDSSETGHEEEVARIRISAKQARAAQEFIWGSFVRRASEPTVYADGPYPGSAFYLSAYRYSVVHTCNTWAAEVLQAAGLPVHTTGVMFAGQLWSQVHRIDTAQHRQISAREAPGAVLALQH
jgi:hypothetical protein